MAVHIAQDGPATVLAQRVDRNLNNDIDIVHGVSPPPAWSSRPRRR
ncbi:hypothetical protein I549_3743 [Mycobacterium avium subsp. avium 2285 (R)]|nr:hypothetical protein I549_3743 [Mycobacterium avium subsp. avium 2285 (R)]